MVRPARVYVVLVEGETPLATRKLSSRVEAAFAGSHQKDGTLSPKEYLEIVRSHWDSAETALRRVTLGLFLAAAISQLISAAGAAELDIGPVRIKDLTIVNKLLPVAFAYLTLEWVAIAVLINRLGSVHDAIIRFAYPRLYDEGLHLPLAPTVMSLASEARIVGEPGMQHRAMRTLTNLKTVSFVTLLLLAQVVFYWQQFSTFGFTDVFVWAFLSVAALFLVQTLVLLPKFVVDRPWTM